MDEARSQWLTDESQIIYILATAIGDSNLMPAIEDRAPVGTQARKAQDEYWFSGYYGRGFSPIALITKDSYIKFSELLKIDLTGNPDLALDTTTAAQILVTAMKNGSFTGFKLSDYITSFKQDFLGARAVVKPNDRNNLFSDYTKSIITPSVADDGSFGLKTFQYLTVEKIIASCFANPGRKNLPDLLSPFGFKEAKLMNSYDDRDMFLDRNFSAFKIRTTDYRPDAEVFNSYLYALDDSIFNQFNTAHKTDYVNELSQSKWYGPYIERPSDPSYFHSYIVSSVPSGNSKYQVILKMRQSPNNGKSKITLYVCEGKDCVDNYGDSDKPKPGPAPTPKPGASSIQTANYGMIILCALLAINLKN